MNRREIGGSPYKLGKNLGVARHLAIPCILVSLFLVFVSTGLRVASTSAARSSMHLTSHEQSMPENAGPGSYPELVEITDSTGITFEHFSSPEQKYIVESMSGGVALIDYDRDGWPDIYFTNAQSVAMALSPTSPTRRVSVIPAQPREPSWVITTMMGGRICW